MPSASKDHNALKATAAGVTGADKRPWSGEHLLGRGIRSPSVCRRKIFTENPLLHQHSPSTFTRLMHSLGGAHTSHAKANIQEIQTPFTSHSPLHQASDLRCRRCRRTYSVWRHAALFLPHFGSFMLLSLFLSASAADVASAAPASASAASVQMGRSALGGKDSQGNKRGKSQKRKREMLLSRRHRRPTVLAALRS